MNSNKRTILAIASVAFVFMLVITGAAQMADVSSADMSDANVSLNDGNVPTASLTAPLVFNNTEGASSVSMINKTAGADVCVYKNGTLSFTRSVNIKLDGTIANSNLFTFNENSDQGINVAIGCTVQITCPSDKLNMTDNMNHAVIFCESVQGFAFMGSGALKIDVTGSSVAGIYGYDIIYAKGSLYFDGNNLTCKNDECNAANTDGVVFCGNNLIFTECNVKIDSKGYAFRSMNDHINFTFDRCILHATGAEKAFCYSGSTTTCVSGTTVYGKDSSGNMKEIDALDIKDYQTVEAALYEEKSWLDSNLILIGACIAIGAFLFLVIAILIPSKKKS